MRIRAAILVTALGVLLGSLAAGALFNSLFFHRFLVNTYDSRLLAVALDVRDVFARAVALGLPLAQFDGGGAVIDEARKADPAITRIRVFQAQAGHFTALAHGGATAGEALPESWERAIRRAPAAIYWPIDEDSAFGVLVPINSSFGKIVGLAALLQTRTAIAEPQRRFDDFLIRVVAGVGLPAALVLAVALILLLRPTLSRLPLWSDHAAALLAAGQSGQPLPAAPEPDPTGMLDQVMAEPLAMARQALAAGREHSPS